MTRKRIGAKRTCRASEVFLALTIFAVIAAPGAQHSVAQTAAPETISSVLANHSTKPVKSYHDGSIRDLSAVGSRDIGCSHGPAKRYSREEQLEMGRAYAQHVETESRQVSDPVITEYVNRIGQSVARNSDAQGPFIIKVIDSSRVNAFSLPGGFLYVNSGLILAVDNEAELAAVMSHEIAHVAACHAAQEAVREELTNAASMPLIFRLAFRHVTANTNYLTPTRSFESEADFLGVQYLYKAGYDPRAMASLFEKIKENEGPGGRAKVLELHPQMDERIKTTREEIDELLPPGKEYKLDSSEFQNIKERLSGLKKQQGEDFSASNAAR